MQAEQQSELLPCPFCGAAAELVACGRSWWSIAVAHDESCMFDADHQPTVPKTEVQKEMLVTDWNRRAALSHPSTPQGWKLIGWTCGEGDCGRIHESPGAEGSYAVPVYVPSPPEQGGKG